MDNRLRALHRRAQEVGSLKGNPQEWNAYARELERAGMREDAGEVYTQLLINHPSLQEPRDFLRCYDEQKIFGQVKDDHLSGTVDMLHTLMTEATAVEAMAYDKKREEKLLVQIRSPDRATYDRVDTLLRSRFDVAIPSQPADGEERDILVSIGGGWEFNYRDIPFHIHFVGHYLAVIPDEWAEYDEEALV